MGQRAKWMIRSRQPGFVLLSEFMAVLLRCDYAQASKNVSRYIPKVEGSNHIAKLNHAAFRLSQLAFWLKSTVQHYAIELTPVYGLIIRDPKADDTKGTLEAIQSYGIAFEMTACNRTRHAHVALTSYGQM
ncbi:uncharacterized protein F5Z01DRAFT_754049 [Emericellopsis atlantica]|uniref:Uncharacterized protein n=1 Tax=Emericellopsis atlantica TaxID=2614577 RepID=A0A9P8CKI5_9HYPO|nr:uncharacterized protein F5Z01DRAFT_754049 [Emericellopsis atlantica]KAG9249975.1 hypothetical protein F5Z01DRAFT_754049 [Emericellopsis atlantica]